MSLRRGMADSAVDLVGRVGRRLRWVWFTAFLQWLLPFSAAAALLVVGLGFVGWPASLTGPSTTIAFAVIAGTVIGVAAAAIVRPIPAPIAARVADRGLRSADALITAHELRAAGALGPLDGDVLARADRLAHGGRARAVAPLRFEHRRLLLTIVLLGTTVAAVLLPSPAEQRAARTRTERAVVRAQAARLRRAAASLGSRGKGATAAADQLRALAATLDRDSSLQRARADVQRRSRSLASAAGEGSLAQKTATLGLERSVATRPLDASSTGARSAAQQLRDAASSLASKTPAEREALAKRLEALAAAQRSANPALADALQKAADAIRAGDFAKAAQALTQAAAAQQAAARRAEQADAAAAAANEAAQTDAALAEAQQAPSSEQRDATTPAGANDGSQQGSSQQGGAQQSGQPSAEAGRPGEGQGQPQGGASAAGGGDRQVAANPENGGGARRAGGQSGSASPGEGRGQPQLGSSDGTGGSQGQQGSDPGSQRGAGQGQQGSGQSQGSGQGQQGSGQGQQGQGAGQQGQGAGQQPGQGQGGGQAQQSGPGQGAGLGTGAARDRGQGQGQGQGPGQAQGAGAPSGRVGGRIDDGGPNVGIGGPGTPGGSGAQPLDRKVSASAERIYQPPAAPTAVLSAQPGGRAGDGQTVAKVDAPTRDGAIRVPLADALPRYSRQATEAARSATLTPNERSVVRTYFDRLAAAANGTADEPPTQSSGSGSPTRSSRSGSPTRSSRSGSGSGA